MFSPVMRHQDRWFEPPKFVRRSLDTGTVGNATSAATAAFSARVYDNPLNLSIAFIDFEMDFEHRWPAVAGTTEHLCSSVDGALFLWRRARPLPAEIEASSHQP